MTKIFVINIKNLPSSASVSLNLNLTPLGLVPEFRAKFKAEICDRIYTDTSGVIFSPNHPDLYPNQLDCTIQISLKDSQLKIQVRDSRTDKKNLKIILNGVNFGS